MRTPAARFADLHSHVLPGVDDGSRSMPETLRSLRDFREAGVATVAVSPHLYLWNHPDEASLRARLEALREAFEQVRAGAAGQAGMPELLPGQEICAQRPDDLLRVVDDPGVGIAGTRFLLVEFGFELCWADPEGVIRAARAAGREVVVAHPERYRFPPGADPVDAVRRWRDLGAWLQVNLGSLHDRGGPYGGEAERLGWRLLEEGLAHLVSSDHHGESRPQIHHAALFGRLARDGGARQAELLLGANVLRVLRGQAPEEVPPLRAAAA